MPHVLIIDSETSVAEAIDAELVSRGATVRVTGDGSEGLEYAKASAPDLIVLCVELTRGSGYSVCNKLKKDSQLATIPLILTSAQATEETFEQHKKLRTRAEAYLKKPFEATQIVSLMQDYIDIDGGSPSVAVDDDELEISADDLSLEPEALDVEAETVVEPDDELGSVATVAVAAASAGAVAEAVAGSRRTTDVIANEAETETVRSENRQLRQRIERLERQLQEKEVEFSDRLLEESGRAREGLDAKTRLKQMERELQKYQQLAERAQAEANQHQNGMQELRSEIANLEAERQVLSDKLGQVVEKVKSLATERDAVRGEIRAIEDERSENAEHEETARKVREKARKAVDIAVQLIDETGLAH